MRILLVEDEEKVLNFIARGLESEGFAIDQAKDGRTGLEFFNVYPYDLIILDIMLPELNGTELLEKIRRSGRQVPVLMLTAKDSVTDKVAHFNAGADDYLTKPFAFAELQARIRALLRRGNITQANNLTIADLEIDRLGRSVKRAGKRMDLSSKEFSLLEYMAMNAGRVLSRTMIIEHVWDQSFEGLTNIVDVYVRQLRNKIDNNYEPKLIRTVRGVGYCLNSEE